MKVRGGLLPVVQNPLKTTNQPTPVPRQREKKKHNQQQTKKNPTQTRISPVTEAGL